MKLTLAFLALLAAGVLLIVLIGSANGESPHRWAALPGVEFRSLVPTPGVPSAGETAPPDTSQNTCGGRSETSPGAADRTPRSGASFGPAVGADEPGLADDRLEVSGPDSGNGGLQLAGHDAAGLPVLVAAVVHGLDRPSLGRVVPEFALGDPGFLRLVVDQVCVPDLHCLSRSVAVVYDKCNTPVKPTPAPSPRPTPRPTGRIGTPALGAKGWATYQPGTGLWASPSAYIRAWPGSNVWVCGPLACRSIELRNECACGLRHGIRTLIDLAEPAWITLCGDPSIGVCAVTVTR